MARLTPQEDRSLRRVAVRTTIKNALRAVLDDIVDSDLDANEVAELLGAAGLLPQPAVVQNLLQRRHARQS